MTECTAVFHMLFVIHDTLFAAVADTGTLTVCEEVWSSLPTGTTNPWVSKQGLGDIISMWKLICPLTQTSNMLHPGCCGGQGVNAVNNGELFTDILVCGPVALLTGFAAVGHKLTTPTALQRFKHGTTVVADTSKIWAIILQMFHHDT